MDGFAPLTDDEGEDADKIIIGPDNVVRLTDPQADMKVVEHTGSGIEAGRTDLQDIEAQAANIGAQMLAKKIKKTTSATEEAGDQKSEDSRLCAMVKATEDGLTLAINLMYEWEQKDPPKGKLVTINTDFGLTPQDAADLQALYQSRMAGQITHKTYLDELHRRGVLAANVDIEREVEEAKKEGPVPLPQKDNSPSTMGSPKQGETHMTQKEGAGA